MLKTHIKRIIKSGFFSFFRNGFVSLSSVAVMVVTLSVIGFVVFFSAMLNMSLDHIRDKVDINVYFVKEALSEDVLAIKTQLETLSEVRSVEYVSAEDELKSFRERHQNDQFTLQALEELGENPLGAKINIKAQEPQQYEGIARFLESDALLSKSGTVIVDTINYEKNKDAIDKLINIIDSANRLGLFFTLVLIIISILITFNTIRLVIFISKEEISVMRLVGASTFYIRGPFIVSGIMYGFIAGLLTLVLFYPVTLWLGGLTEEFFVGLNVFEYYITNFPQIFLIVVGAGVVIGAVSSYLAVRRYLRT
jgi:cell division transport system permease protein